MTIVMNAVNSFFRSFVGESVTPPCPSFEKAGIRRKHRAFENRPQAQYDLGSVAIGDGGCS